MEENRRSSRLDAKKFAFPLVDSPLNRNAVKPGLRRVSRVVFT